MKTEKATLLSQTVEHIDIKKHEWLSIVDAMRGMSFQARNLARAADIYCQMLEDQDCAVILCLAGSLISAGLKKVVIDLIKHNMVDAIVSTGANIVDQDFFEALGFRHYHGHPQLDDEKLQSLMIDRIYDTLIDEEHLRICDETICGIANNLAPKPYSSREFIVEMGRYLETNAKADSIILTAKQKQVPIFIPAMSDCSAGFGLVMHQMQNPENHISHDSVKDFRELTEIKCANPETGLLMMGGGVPKNFAQDIVVAADLLGKPASLHKYAVQVTVADERDGALSGSTLQEACSWGKVSTTYEQMVYAEATLALPMIAGYAYAKKAWQKRKARELNSIF